MKFTIIIIYLALSFSIISKAQGAYPVIGKPCPAFVLQNSKNAHLKVISPKSLKGKFFIIDFFSLGCTECFGSFSHVNSIADKFKDSATIVVVGHEFGNIAKVFDDFAQEYSLELPVFYSKSIFDQFKIFGVPHVLWVNNKGIVVAVSTNEEITEENVRKFIHGDSFPFWDKSYAARLFREKFNLDHPMLVKGNGGSDTSFLYRSVLVKHKQSDSFDFYGSFKGTLKMPFSMPGKKAYQGFCLSLAHLYRLAFTGTFSWSMTVHTGADFSTKDVSPDLILLTRDSLLFQTNSATGEGFYNYSMILPADKATPEKMQRILQNDLDSYFHLNVSIEMRKLPYFAIVIDSLSLAEIKTKGTKSSATISYSHVTFNNMTIEASLEYQLQHAFGSKYMIFDKTNSNEHIDLDSKFFMTDFDKTKAVLDSIGIHLVQRDTFLKAIVVRDADS